MLNISGSKQSSTSTSKDSVFLADIFSKLYGGATGAAAGIDTSGITEAANSLFQQGAGFLSTVGDVAAGTDASGQYLTSRVNGAGGTADAQITDLKTQLDQFFNETLLPGITAEAAGGGVLGGARQGVAQGAAAQGVLNTFGQGVTAIRTADTAQRDALATQLASQRVGAAGAGAAMLPGQLGLANEAAFAPLSPYAALAQILGDPTVLNTSTSSSKGKSFSFGFGSPSSAIKGLQ